MTQTKLERIKTIFDRLVDRRKPLAANRFTRELKIIDSTLKKMPLKDRYAFILHAESKVNMLSTTGLDANVSNQIGTNILSKKFNFLSEKPSECMFQFMLKNTGVDKILEEFDGRADSIDKIYKKIIGNFGKENKSLKIALEKVKKIVTGGNHPGNDLIH